MMKLLVLVAMALVASANADCYMHNPAGSNNRLNENSADRNNGDRLFDSQNNNRGGYNACDKGTNAASANAGTMYFKGDRETAAPDQIYDENSDRNEAIQYPMLYVAGSELHMEWAVQHGCGGNEEADPTKLNCNMVIQYACDQDVKVKGENTRDEALSVFLTNGVNTNQPGTTGGNANNNDDCNNDNRATLANIQATIAANDAGGQGRHESEANYCECQMRSRDDSLFVADQNLQGDVAQYTRQNAGGGRRGLECPEERDYYPYNSPNMWRDAAYLTDDVARCPSIQALSMNVASKYKCQEANADGLLKAVVNNIDQASCNAANGNWNDYSYSIPAPECAQAPFTRVNHLGNARGDGVSPETASYNMTIPTWSTLTEGAIPVKTYPANGANAGQYAKCVVRIRYNVSTDDYDPWTISASSNGAANSPVVGNPDVEIGLGAATTLALAIDTSQYGRTFEDRSHVFFIKKPTADVQAMLNAGKTILNLNVRGKRGTVTQTYPSVKYDFTPTSAEVRAGDLVHVQWCGSNTHNNGNPGGDGEAGGEGEGAEGTDRHSMVMLRSFDDSFPAPYDKYAELGINNLFAESCIGADSNNVLNPMDCAVRAASSGYYKTSSELSTRDMNAALNNTPASFVGGGLLVSIPESCSSGTKYRYMATRNNKLGVSGQKGVITCVQTA